jgi:hypothetical protein
MRAIVGRVVMPDRRDVLGRLRCAGGSGATENNIRLSSEPKRPHRGLALIERLCCFFDCSPGS